MDDVQIITSNDYKEKKSSGLKIFIIIFTLIILSLGVAGLSYFLGTKYSERAEIAKEIIAPTQTTEPTPPDKVQTATASTDKKPSPGSKASPTLTTTPTPILKTKILPSVASLDGFRSSNGGGNNTLEIRAGRNSALVTRGFVSFEISEIPSEANIQSAVLRLYQARTVGKPYAAGGPLKIDHLTYGDALDSSNYASPALSTSFATLSDETSIGWKEVDVTARLKDDVANARYTSQFRIHFQTEVAGGDVTGDFVYFEAQENSMETGNTPQLIVKYY
jgi:hypothetical protein